jgi:hypothetical protein
LNLSSNKFSDKGLDCLSESLSKISYLRSLNIHLNNNEISDNGIKPLIISLPKLIYLNILTINFGFKNNQDKKVLQLFKSRLINLKEITLN